MTCLVSKVRSHILVGTMSNGSDENEEGKGSVEDDQNDGGGDLISAGVSERERGGGG